MIDLGEKKDRCRVGFNPLLPVSDWFQSDVSPLLGTLPAVRDATRSGLQHGSGPEPGHASHGNPEQEIPAAARVSLRTPMQSVQQ